MSLILIGVLGADQASKAVVRSVLSLREPYPVVPPVLYLTHVENTGAAFGLFSDRPLLLALLTFVVVIAVLFGARTLAAESAAVQWAVALAVGGATGNMIDRVARGAVTDFLDVRVWPIFNVADVGIVIGVSLLIVHLLRGERS